MSMVQMVMTGLRMMSMHIMEQQLKSLGLPDGTQAQIPIGILLQKPKKTLMEPMLMRVIYLEVQYLQIQMIVIPF